MESKKFTIKSEYKNVSSVCFIAKTFCEEHLIPEEKTREIELSLAEALNNIIKHSYKGNENNKIEIAMDVSDNDFTVKLTDYGEARKNLNKPVLEFDPNDIDGLPEGGMGLFIIEQLMDNDQYAVEENENTFTLVKQ